MHYPINNRNNACIPVQFRRYPTFPSTLMYANWRKKGLYGTVSCKCYIVRVYRGRSKKKRVYLWFLLFVVMSNVIAVVGNVNELVFGDFFFSCHVLVFGVVIFIIVNE